MPSFPYNGLTVPLTLRVIAPLVRALMVFLSDVFRSPIFIFAPFMTTLYRLCC